MGSVSRHSDIADRAYRLGLGAPDNPFQAIVAFAMARVGKLLAECPIDVESPSFLRNIFESTLSIDCEFVDHDADFDRIIDIYDGQIPGLRSSLEEIKNGSTEGMLLRRPYRGRGDREFLAVVDARGAQSARAYFTMWHEISHILVEPEPESLELVRRSPSEKQKREDPVEAVVDAVTAQLAFYEPIFQPKVDNVLKNHPRLTFKAIKEIREAYDPAASFHATAIAVIRHVREPCCLARLGKRRKAKYQQIKDSTQVEIPGLEISLPPPDLRVVELMESEQGKSIFNLHPNIRVPDGSVAHRVFQGTIDTDIGLDDQAGWERSKSDSLPSLPMYVEAAEYGPNVFALFTLAETHRGDN